MAIDTLGYVKKLEAAGMDRRLAEAHAEAMNEKVLPLLATSQDVKQLETSLRSELQQVRKDFENLMMKHTIAVVFTVIAVAGLAVRFAS